MSSFYDKIHSVLEEELSERELVELWNYSREKGNYEPLYSMSEFNDLVAGDKSYQEVKQMLGKNFDDNASYFYIDGYGKVQSVDDYMSVVNIDELTDFVFNEVPDRNFPSEIEELFTGETFVDEMTDVIDQLPEKDIDFMTEALKSNGYEISEDYHDYNDIPDALEQVIRDDAPCDFVYLFPKEVQSKFFEFRFADEDYLKANINRVGPVPAKEALELAGFKCENEKKNLYSQRTGNYTYNQYEIKIKDNVIKSVVVPKHEMVR